MSTAGSKTDFGRQMVRGYEIGRRMVASLVEDFSDEEAQKRVNALKPLVWYLAHIVVSESTLLDLYFDQRPTVSGEFMDRFGRGSDGSGDFSDMQVAEMRTLLDGTRERMRAALGTMTSDDTERTPAREIEHPAFGTLGVAAALISHHNAYHAGQIALIRTALGKDRKFG